MKLSEKKLFLFDIDGTLAVGDELLPESRELLADIEARGGRSYFITNNSTRSQEDYVKRFREVFGLMTTPDQFATSSYVSALALRELFAEASVFLVGTDSLAEELRRFGVNAVAEQREDLAAILVGYDSSLTYEKLCVASELLQTTELPWYAT
ncbi:MAG: haloacid dehalogenase, partial [Butyricicoccus sp.]|nr:haloacid dehalogenase [Butyricicoccus sp.]